MSDNKKDPDDIVYCIDDHAPLDYAVEPGQPCPCCHKTTWLDRLWNWIRR